MHLTDRFAHVEHALFDVQWLTPHLASLGASRSPVGIPHPVGVGGVRPVDPFS